jgi:hypothetical protein
MTSAAPKWGADVSLYAVASLATYRAVVVPLALSPGAHSEQQYMTATALTCIG